MHTFFLLFLIIPLVIAGLFLIRRGRHPRRHGQTPHCRKCEYNLTGLTSDKCPECGNPLQPDGIVLGEGHRSGAKVTAGIFCFFPALLLLIVAANAINWYQFRPAAWLVSDLASTNTTTANRAWTELDRRDKAGSLSASQRSNLIDTCLKAQAAPTTGPLTSGMVDYLGRKCLANELSSQQFQTFAAQIVILALEIRPRSIAGEWLPYRVREQSRGPSSPFWIRLTIPQTSVDGKVVREDSGGYSSFSGTGAGGSSGNSVKIDTPGRHALGVTARAQLYSGPFGDETKCTLVSQQTYSLKGETEILAAAPPDYVKPVHKPDLAAQLQPVFKPGDFKFTDGRLQGEIDASSIPTAVAFDVIFRVNGQEHALSTISSPGGGGTCSYHISASERTPPFETCDIILRGSEKAARNTVELFEYWDGELVYKDVPVKVEGPTTQPTQPAGQ